ncbi:SGNH/GDSL hydrolase family protein [Ramlibacter sp. WS9]|uniref:SGNH/GDSL hydrolase family protein n=1 Tax=Ramlibacter sp. WS9 TaxID=1882741 RepID=UPI001142C0E6|nr:SGNH/GDSL hydrolase family protein [Ramlibacter sp. WS9]ROZ72384.1 SGNH/GDSL hydrolase family protein [Ramlibacter sp. WS9]
MSVGIFAAKIALGPVLLPQARWLRRTALRLPEAAGPRQGQVGEGETVLRVLVVGDSAAAGVGVTDQTQALTMQLAHALSDALRGAIGWQLVAQSGINTAECRALAAQANLQAADVVVTVLGVNDVSSQTTASRFAQGLSLLWADLQQRTGAQRLVVCGVPPMHLFPAIPQPLRWYLGRYAMWLDRAGQRWTEQERLGYCPVDWPADDGFVAADGFHPGAALYPLWAQRLAGLIAGQRVPS